MHRRVAVVGAGAVGSYFGAKLAQAGIPVTLIAREAHAAAINRNGLILETREGPQSVRLDAASDIAAARGADLVLLCVKTRDTVATAAALKPHLQPDAVIVSLQNGVDNPERVAREVGLAVVPAVVYVAVALPEPGRVKHAGRGDLVIGGPFAKPVLERIAATFAKANVPCRISDTIATAMWTKLAQNCAYNPISALTGATYGVIIKDAGMLAVMRAVVEECVAVATAKAIALDLAATLEAVFGLAAAMPQQISSTAQDIARGKLTETDSLNGYVSTEGERLKIPTAVNATLHRLVRLRELQTAAVGTSQRN